MISPDSPIHSIPRISPIYQKRLLKLGIKTLRDLFYHFPFRYDDFSNIKKVGELKLNETATVQGKISDIKNTRTWRKRIFVTEAYVQDETGVIKAVWFNQPFLINTLKPDQSISLSGRVNFDKELYLSNPAYEKINPPHPSFTKEGDSSLFKGRIGGTLSNLHHTGRLVAVYSETTGLSSRWLRYMIKTLAPQAMPQFKDFLPLEIKRSQNLLDLDKAILQIHFPNTKKHAEQARRRLAFDELFLIQLSVLQQKIAWQKQSAPRIVFNQPLIKKFVDSLPFQLTNAQRKAAWEILRDLIQAKPMNRLLEGDVGSGKTVVAALVALEVVSDRSISDIGYQVALMAPTEILAQQHFKTVSQLLASQNITIGLLTGSDSIITNNSPHPPLNLRGGESASSAKQDEGALKKTELLKQVANGNIQILIGTHALIQETVAFKNLALVIIDEQHRFGVSQRATLQKNIGKIQDGLAQTTPHLLSMTATPIPRTLTLTIYGDLDISLLDQMPKGRQEIITKIVAPANRQKAYEFIRQQVKERKQVFVICPRIESSNENSYTASPPVSSDVKRQTINDTSRDQRQTFNDRRNWDDVKAVKQEYEKLSKIVFPDLKIAMLHGKLKAKEKEKIMLDFSAKGGSPPDGRAGASGGKNKIDILVSTSVIEVGIDVPNATVMMIEGADRFGLAQLHQFRGRVGRGPHQSYCFLFTESNAKNTNARLKALITCKNGFELAEKDLQIRGPGEFYGTRQWGLPDLSMASLSDISFIKSVREEAQKLIQKDPELKNYPLLQKKLKQFQTSVHLE